MVGGGKQWAIPGDKETRIYDGKGAEKRETTRERTTSGERYIGGKM